MTTKSFLLCALFVVSTLPGVPRADDSVDGQALADRHNRIWEHTLGGFYEVYQVHGRTLRIAGALDACELEGLAKAIMPSDKAVTDALSHYISGKTELQPYLMELLASVKASMFFYRVGVKEGMASTWHTMDKQERNAICSGATDLANKLLTGGDAGKRSNAQDGPRHCRSVGSQLESCAPPPNLQTPTVLDPLSETQR